MIRKFRCQCPFERYGNVGQTHLALPPPAGRCVVPGDRSMIAQALVNVVDDALKHGGAGGDVAVHVEQSESASTITVSNSGSLLATEEIEHVTERFFREARLYPLVRMA